MDLLLACGVIVLCEAVQSIVVSMLLRNLCELQSRHLIGTTIVSITSRSSVIVAFHCGS
jgi:hypothetical protein